MIGETAFYRTVPMHLEWSREGRVATVAIRRRLDAMSVTNYYCKSQDCSVNSTRNSVTKTIVLTAIPSVRLF